MTDERREVRPPVTVRELVEGEIVGIARVDFEDDGSGGGTNVVEIPDGQLAAGSYELEFEDGTRFVAKLEPQLGRPHRLNVLDVQ
jgi:hypothetical protein